MKLTIQQSDTLCIIAVIVLVFVLINFDLLYAIAVKFFW